MENELHSQGPTTATPPQRVPVIYVRSAATGDGQLEERLEDALELARMNGLDVAAADTVAEHGSGANIVGRPGLQRLLQMAERGEISHLVTRKTSHLSRNYHHLHEMLVALAEAGVTVITGEGDNEPRGTYALATAVFETPR